MIQAPCIINDSKDTFVQLFANTNCQVSKIFQLKFERHLEFKAVKLYEHISTRIIIVLANIRLGTIKLLLVQSSENTKQSKTNVSRFSQASDMFTFLRSPPHNEETQILFFSPHNQLIAFSYHLDMRRISLLFNTTTNFYHLRPLSCPIRG